MSLVKLSLINALALWALGDLVAEIVAYQHRDLPQE
jgi:hypothetical protein